MPVLSTARFASAAIAIALLGALSACSSAAPADGVANTATSATGAAAPTSPTAPETDAAAPSDSPPSPVATPAASTTPAAPTPESPPTPPTRDDATVDARDYQSGPAFYFQSPSGNILCGIYPGDPQLGAGCQAVDAPVSPDGPPCENSATSAIGIKLAGGGAQRICLNQGVYVGPPVDGTNRGGGKVLAYGDTIIVQTVACRSTEAGITCWEAGSGFTLSRETNEVF